jgi:hypothetical protein
MKIEAILDRPADNICLDHLARVLVDVHQVTSRAAVASLHSAEVTSHLTPRTSHLTPHTSHLTPHTSHLTPHTVTLHLTPHTSHRAPQDSSQIISDVLSSYQRSLLDMIFMRDADNRSKFNVITRCLSSRPQQSQPKTLRLLDNESLMLRLFLSDSITPKLPHEK